VEQRRRQLPVCVPQQKRPRQPQQQPRLPPLEYIPFARWTAFTDATPAHKVCSAPSVLRRHRPDEAPQPPASGSASEGRRGLLSCTVRGPRRYSPAACARHPSCYSQQYFVANFYDFPTSPPTKKWWPKPRKLAGTKVWTRPEADEEARFPAVEGVFPVASAGGAPATDVRGVRGIRLAVGYVPRAVIGLL
jgi:hypothetical protein